MVSFVKGPALDLRANGIHNRLGAILPADPLEEVGTDKVLGVPSDAEKNPVGVARHEFSDEIKIGRMRRVIEVVAVEGTFWIHAFCPAPLVNDDLFF